MSSNFQKESKDSKVAVEEETIATVDEVIDTRGRGVDDVPHQAVDREVKENMHHIFGNNGAYEWRMYGKSAHYKQNPQKYKDKDGMRIDRYNPRPCPCPAYVKKDPNSPFQIGESGLPEGNVKRCNHEVPKELKGKQVYYYTIAHMKKHHFEDWYDVNKRTHENGGLSETDNRKEAPPTSTQVEWPRWTTNLKDDAHYDITDHERIIRSYEKGKVGD